MRTSIAAIGVVALIPLAACGSGTSHAQQVKVCERYMYANFSKYLRNSDWFYHRPAQCDGVTTPELKRIMADAMGHRVNKY